MKIFSVRKGFTPDHSSTSYEFYAVDKPLEKAQRQAVAKLSSRANPTQRKVSFIYHGDWNDLPGGWEPLLRKYYDVMYSESYDQWALAFGFHANQHFIEEIKKYGFVGEDDLGTQVETKNGRVVIAIYCRLSPDMVYDHSEDNRHHSYDDYDEDEEDSEPEGSRDRFMNLLIRDRELLKEGDFRLLHGVWKKYGDDSGGELDVSQKYLGKGKMPKFTKALLDLLDAV